MKQKFNLFGTEGLPVGKFSLKGAAALLHRRGELAGEFVARFPAQLDLPPTDRYGQPDGGQVASDVQVVKNGLNVEAGLLQRPHSDKVRWHRDPRLE